MGLHVCQMMGYGDIMESYKFITENAARTLNLGESYGIKAGNAANFIIMDADNWYDALNRDAVMLRSYRGGKLIAKNEPGRGEVLL
jgi:cytosine deaminase